MRSDAIDQLLGSYLEMPVKVGWEGAAVDALLGRFDGARVELAGIATSWLRLKRIVLTAERARISPDVPPRLEIEKPRVEISIDQAEIDRWLGRFELPFRLELAEEGLGVRTEIAGFPVAAFETRLEVVRGWFVLRPRKASLLGVPGWVPSLFRSYLPLPPLTEDARVVGIGHGAGSLSLTIALDDFEERVGPGLLERLRHRVLPFGQ